MGRESRVAFMPASSEPGASAAPIENSPPWIQTILGGAGPGGGVLSDTVGANTKYSPGSVFSSATLALEDRGQTGPRDSRHARLFVCRLPHRVSQQGQNFPLESLILFCIGRIFFNLLCIFVYL